jgi:uncharacterized membrane protein YqaE (UPF0057 family)
MNKNWIVLVFALLALASCSVEKRVYQPGYHIEWNHYAKQDAEQDASRDVAQDAERDASQDLSENLETDVSQELSENLEIDVSQGRSEGVFQDVSQGRSEGVFQDAEQGRSEGASQNSSQDLPQDLSENLETVVSQDLSENLETFVSQGTGQSIDSDLELILLIVLALFLPALTIFLLEGFSKNFWIALLLMAVAYLLPFSSFITRGLIVAIATILAIAVVFHYL